MFTGGFKKDGASSGPDHVYRADIIRECNAKTATDKVQTNISGICVLSDGNTVVVDWTNKKLKLLDKTYSVIDEYGLPAHPTDICHISDTEVAVAVDDYNNGHEIKFINPVRGNITCQNSVKLDHGCFGIDYHNGQLYIGGADDGLYIYSINFTNKRKIYNGGANKVVVSEDGKQLYLIDGDGSSVVVLNADGTVIATLRDEELRGTTGLAAGNNGSVFVNGNSSHNVLQVDKTGKKIGKVVDGNDGVYGPQCLYVNKRTDELFIGQYKDGNDLLVVKMV